MARTLGRTRAELDETMDLREFWAWFAEFSRRPWGVADVVLTEIGKKIAKDGGGGSKFLRGRAAIGVMKTLSTKKGAA